MPEGRRPHSIRTSAPPPGVRPLLWIAFPNLTCIWPIDVVNTVVFDPEGRFDGEQYDRYASFTEGRDAALSSIEIMLDEEESDGEDHREELERMLGHLESSSLPEELERTRRIGGWSPGSGRSRAAA